jgi:elongator complex protein 4
LDSLLAGHAGLALGTSLLIQETGTTDFGGILLRYYAAEGVAQHHQIHALGYPEDWARTLPGIAVQSKEHASRTETANENMKIAWRYEKLRKRGPGT